MKNELNIVVVDDNSSTLYLLKTIIKQFCMSQKCNLSTFSNYKKLIDYVQDIDDPTIIDLLILDYTVPDMNGDQFLLYYPKLNLTCPIIFITGSPEKDLQHKLLQKEKVFRVLEKPFDTKLFYSTIKKALIKTK